MKKKIVFGIIGVIFVLLILLFTKDTKEKHVDSSNDNPYIRTATNVTADMLNPSFWINSKDSSSEIVMNEKEIQNWNKAYEEILKKGGAIFPAALEKDMENVQYGFTVNRGAIREMPTNERVYESEEEKYFCQLQVSSILMNEPVIVHQEDVSGEWYYITCRYCSGWIEKNNIALCENWQQWKECMDYEEFLLVTGNKEILEVDEETPEVSELVLYMGTKLELVKWEDYVAQAKAGNENNRVPYENYLVKVPTRNADGMLVYKYAFVPVSRDVNVGYLPYNLENLISQMFKINGDRYGWGGMYNARDCSQYVMEVYSLFGFQFARNSAAQASMPFDGYDISDMSNDEKKKILEEVPIGSLLYFEGHIMLYLGKVNDEYYVISETARILENDNESPVNAHSCMITALSIGRPNGRMWLEELSVIKIIR